MINADYQEAIVETIFVLQNSQEEVINKIPLKIIKFLKENASTTYLYNPTIDENAEIDISKLELKPKTKALLGVLYRDYLCNEEEKVEYNKKILENERNLEQKLQEEYSGKDIFPQKNKTKKITDNNLPEVIKTKNIFQRIIEKIIKIFK